MIGTSISISQDRLILLQKAVCILGINETELLSILLQKSRMLFGTQAITGRAVEYQRGSEEEFKIHHVIMTETDYELATSRRYVFKISVSFLFALAISRLLNGIIYEIIHNKTKARQTRNRYITNKNYRSFSIGHFEDVSSEFWQIPWPKE